MSFAVLATSLLAIGAFWKSSPQKVVVASAALPATAMSRQTVLHLSGSDPAATGLLSSLAEAYLTRRGASDVHRTPSGNLEPITVEGRFSKENIIQVIEIAGPDSGHGEENLAGGWAEISLSPRRVMPNPAPLEEHALASYGLAVIVHPDNPLAALSRNHVVTLLAGLITDWRQLKQNPGEIHVYLPEEESEGYETLLGFFPGIERPGLNARRLADSAQIADAVAKDANGIGIVATDRTGQAKTVAIEDSEAGRSLPTDANILTGAYPLARRLYLYHSKNPDNPAVREFVSLSLSPIGRDLANHAGFVSLGSWRAMAAGEGGNSEYARLTSNALHLSFDVHFRPASTQLDAAALDQIRRAETFLRDLGPDNYSLMLLGFSDSRGNPSSHLPVSRLRAQRVAQEFNRRGAAATVVAGLGAYHPVSGGGTPEAEEQRRRVEVWLKQK